MIPTPADRAKVINTIIGALCADEHYSRKSDSQVSRYEASFPYCSIELDLFDGSPEISDVVIAEHTGRQNLVGGPAPLHARLLYRGDADGLLAVDLEESEGPDARGLFAGSNYRLLRSCKGVNGTALSPDDRARFDAFLLYVQCQLQESSLRAAHVREESLTCYRGT